MYICTYTKCIHYKHIKQVANRHYTSLDIMAIVGDEF